MTDTPLNPDEIRAAALANRHAILDEEFWGFSSESDAQDYGFEQGAKWAAQRLAAALPEVTSVEELDQLPAETVVIDAHGFPYRRGHSFGNGHIGDWEGIEYGELLESDTIEYPARVFYRPEVKP